MCIVQTDAKVEKVFTSQFGAILEYFMPVARAIAVRCRCRCKFAKYEIFAIVYAIFHIPIFYYYKCVCSLCVSSFLILFCYLFFAPFLRGLSVAQFDANCNGKTESKSNSNHAIMKKTTISTTIKKMKKKRNCIQKVK